MYGSRSSSPNSMNDRINIEILILEHEGDLQKQVTKVWQPIDKRCLFVTTEANTSAHITYE